MSVESSAIIVLVEEGQPALRTFYGAGVSSEDFVIYDEEFKWCEHRITERRPLNRRIFNEKYPGFEWMRLKETSREIANALRDERAFMEMNNWISWVTQNLDKFNAIDIAREGKEKLREISNQFATMSETVIEDWKTDVEELQRFRKLAKAGAPVGIKTGLAHLDHHLGGLLPGQIIEFLGRTGEGKSYLTTLLALNAKLQGAKVGLFTPEMNRHEVLCRLHTLASARKDVQEACGLERSFRNRALMFGQGFNMKSYERFCQHFEDLPGRIYLLNGTHRRERMTVSMIEERIEEHGLEYVIIDPIYLLKPVRRYKDNEQAEIGATSYAVAALAEQYNIPITITNQANRQGGAQGDAPHKDRSYNSDVPNHVVDYVIGIKHISDENRMIVRCSKSRFGASDFRFELAFYANTGVIKELTPLSGSYFNGRDSDVDDDTIREVVKGTGRSRG